MERRNAALEAARALRMGMSKEDVRRLKTEVARRHGMKSVLRNSEVIEALPKGKEWAVELLKKRVVRTLSGVSPVAVMTKSGCPHGRCAYCPRGENAPQSYTGKEPATMRGIQYGFDPFTQTQQRVKQLEAIGHKTEKVELIIMGGTFNAQEEEYKEHFVRRCFDALNGKNARTIAQAHSLNERARHRCVGLTIETRPDWCREKHVDEMLSWGTTRVELGVQTIYDSVYKKVNRGHSVEDVVKATQKCKDSALKVGYHMMPGLFADKERDLRIFKRLFSEERFKPDMLKLYPCIVLKDTELFEWWKKGEFKPYSTEEAAEVLAEASRFIPPFVRVMRVQRDIPSNLIVDGVKKSNLRQLVDKERKHKGISCRCIRCREVGLKALKHGIAPEEKDFKLKRLSYKASGGEEEFISLEDDKTDSLAGFIRLRMPGSPHRKEIDSNTSLVRELHVYGTALKLGEEGDVQHKGHGARLLAEAERVAVEKFGARKMVVCSGVGVREYYLKHGYKKDGCYVSKRLR